MSCQLQVKVNAGSQWTRRADKNLALLVGHLTLPGVYDVIWRELVGLRGNYSDYWFTATPSPSLAEQSIYLSLLDASIWRRHGFPIPQNSKHMNHQRKLFIFRRISLFRDLISLCRLILADSFTLFLCHMQESHLTTYCQISSTNHTQNDPRSPYSVYWTIHLLPQREHIISS